MIMNSYDAVSSIGFVYSAGCSSPCPDSGDGDDYIMVHIISEDKTQNCCTVSVL